MARVLEQDSNSERANSSYAAYFIHFMAIARVLLADALMGKVRAILNLSIKIFYIVFKLIRVVVTILKILTNSIITILNCSYFYHV